MKKYLMSGALALIAGLFVTSCHDDDVYENINVIDQKTQGFQKAFKEAFGPIAPNQTWGFNNSTRSDISTCNGTSTRELTRAGSVIINTWTLDHSDDWVKYLDFSLPSSYTTLTKDNNTAKSGNVYYVPADFDGTINFDNFNGDIYVAANVKQFWGNPGNVNVYILENGSWECGTSSGSLTIYNKGSLVLGPWDLQTATNIPVIYNGGSLKIGNTDNNPNIANAVKIYSTGDATIEVYAKSGEWDAADFKPICDIHGTLKVTGNIKIQNSTTKYICGIEATGNVENTDGPLQTSYVRANELKFDGNPIYLLPGGHIDVTTLKIPNSGCQVRGYEGDIALVEAKNFEFGNKNDFTHTFSDNVYFKVNGGYVKCDNCYAMGQSHYFNSVDDYLAYEGHSTSQSDEYPLAKDRINAGDAAGSPLCGQAWSIGTGTTQPVTTYQTTYSIEDKVIETGRILCEDLGNFSNREDLDYNDVVFNAQIIQRTYKTIIKTFVDGELTNTDTDVKDQKNFAKIALYAAGGTLELTVAGQEVHNLFGVGITTMVNTRDKNTDTNHSVNGANTVVRDPVEMTNPNYENERNNCTPTDDFKDDRSSSEKENDKYLFYGYDRIIDIPIRVCYEEGEVLELKSEIGGAPHKILVDIDTRWPSERCPINEAYTQFNSYVSGNIAKFWEDGGNEDNLYDKERTISTEAIGDVMETITGEGSVTLNVLWKSEEGYDISRGLYFTNTNLLVNQGIKVGDILRFEGTKTSENWAIFLCDGNSSRIHADQSSLNSQGYAEVTLTADMVSKLKTNNDNAAMVITGYGVSLTRVSLIKK